jgi:hypothetical protein
MWSGSFGIEEVFLLINSAIRARRSAMRRSAEARTAEYLAEFGLGHSLASSSVTSNDCKVGALMPAVSGCLKGLLPIVLGVTDLRMRSSHQWGRVIRRPAVSM